MAEEIKIGARARVINPRSANYGTIVELIHIGQPKSKNYTAYDFKHKNRQGIMRVTNRTLCQFLEFINVDKNTCEIPVQLSLWEG